MKAIEFWRWELLSETVPGKRVKSRHHMTREQALARDTHATPVPGTLEVRQLPENDEEAMRLTHARRKN